MSAIVRETKETTVRIELKPGEGTATVKTGVPFLDHMMVTLARYSGLDMVLEATGDLRHHVSEDVAIATGLAVADIVSPTACRYGERTIPMDDALVQACVDLGGRSFYCGPLPGPAYDHWMRSFSDNAKMTLHIRVIRGIDRHHIMEAAFKALGLALNAALADNGSILSTKGGVSLGSREC
jgi:imidazoleglycerol-phosphate dehydratase